MKTTQGNEILKYLRVYGSITPIEAFGTLGITKLSTRIGELEREGWVFKREWVEHTNADGKVSRFMRYSFGEFADQDEGFEDKSALSS